MKQQITEQQLKRLSRTYRDHSVESLDISASHQLQQARLDVLNGNKRNSHVLQWGSGFAFASLLLAILFYQINPQERLNLDEELILLEEILQIDENQEIVNDLEFYQWLEQQDDLEKIV